MYCESGSRRRPACGRTWRVGLVEGRRPRGRRSAQARRAHKRPNLPKTVSAMQRNRKPYYTYINKISFANSSSMS